MVVKIPSFGIKIEVLLKLSKYIQVRGVAPGANKPHIAPGPSSALQTRKTSRLAGFSSVVDYYDKISNLSFIEGLLQIQSFIDDLDI
jgi:hypothetical protein